MTTQLKIQLSTFNTYAGRPYTLLLPIVIWLLQTVTLYGQVLNPLPCHNQTTLPPACEGQPYHLQLIAHTGGTLAGCTFVTGGLNLQSNTSITLSAAGLLSTASIPVGASSSSPYGFSVQATGESVSSFNLEVRTSGLCSSDPGEVPCMQDVAVVIDQSGSMASGVNPSLPVSATNPSKWSKVGTILNAHFPTMRTSADPDLNFNDRWAIVLFEGNNARIIPAAMGGSGNFATDPDISGIFTTFSPGGGTPMGAGIQEALQTFFNDATTPGMGKRRAIILVTDGDQNMNPMVAGAIGSVQLLNDGAHGAPVVPNSGSALSMPVNLHTGAYGGIQVYSLGIGVGMGTDAQATLDALSRGAGNSRHTSQYTDAQMGTFLNQTVADYLEESSPRILDTRFGVTKGFGETEVETFVVNDSVQSLTLRYMSIDETPNTAAVSVYHNGLPVNAEVTTRSNLQLRHVKFPYQSMTGAMVSSAGTWEFRISNQAGIRYEATAFVDDERLRPRLEVGLPAVSMYAGDDLPVKTKITFKEQPVAGATVTATMYRPGDDLGDLAANTPTPKDLSVNEPGGTYGQAKIDYAVSNPAILSLLELKEKSIVLKDQGNGEYTGVFHGNEVTGNYQVIVRLNGNRSDISNYQGWITKSRFLDFSRPEDIYLQARLIVIGRGDTKGSSRYAVKITPVNKFGRKFGPGQTNRIFVSTSTGSIGTIKDNLDGSYTIPVTAPAGSSPVITVHVIDPAKPVAQNSLFNLPITHPFGISLHTGITLPFDKLDPTYNSGVYGEIDLTYRFNLKWSIEAVGGYYGFKPDYSIVGGSLFGKYTIPALFGGGWNLHFAGGPGAFKPENEDVAFGYGLKAGLGRRLSAHLDLNADFAYYGLPKPGYSFGTSGLGICYFF